MPIPPPESRRLAADAIARIESAMSAPVEVQAFLLQSLYKGGPDGEQLLPPEITEEDLANTETLLAVLRSIAEGD